MNKEEIDKWLDNEYGVSYTSLEEIHDWLVDENRKKDKKIERLNNDIKILLKENENKEKVILKYDNITNELKEWFKGYHKSYASCKWYEEDYIEFIEHLEEELKGDSSNE